MSAPFHNRRDRAKPPAITYQNILVQARFGLGQSNEPLVLPDRLVTHQYARGLRYLQIAPKVGQSHPFSSSSEKFQNQLVKFPKHRGFLVGPPSRHAKRPVEAPPCIRQNQYNSTPDIGSRSSTPSLTQQHPKELRFNTSRSPTALTKQLKKRREADL